MKDKVLAEFLISLADKSSSLEHFQKLLEDNGGEDFPEQFVGNLWKLINKMRPKAPAKGEAKGSVGADPKGGAQESGKAEAGKSEEKSIPPEKSINALSIPNEPRS
uniref:Uncharacterized protein n=1 Tax=Arcella intermedia TaxID=1963864 RepID=A0A6B2LR91_9EUKA